ncbi:hypothetical protein IFM89_025971 [Coptis chinensis]|uniref:IST1-like protein n=1 Tax=Coptis chinensis TaxID=261450 RepID=A0A835IPD9_9MAGN|nr:hypothetical protein IFM89_025971 [Coptis chinensis]
MLKFGLSLFGRGFKSSKCKTMAKMVTARIKLLRNKREVVVRQMRRDVALLLQSKQDATARIRVEHVIREQNIMAWNEIIELFCELVVARLSIIAKQRDCPADLKEGISSLIFAAPRCSDIPELQQLRTIFEKKYGKEFVNAATELRPNCGVNRTLIEKLSVRTPTGEVKLKLMKEIAKEYQIAWDPTESEKELLKLPEELANACLFLSQPVSQSYLVYIVTTIYCRKDQGDLKHESVNSTSLSVSKDRPVNSQDSVHHSEPPGRGYESRSYESSSNLFMSNDPPVNSHVSVHHPDRPERTYESQSFDRSRALGNEDRNRNFRRHSSYNAPAVHSDIKFDESDGPDSDCNEEIEMETCTGEIRPPPDRPPPPLPPSHTYQSDKRMEMDNSNLYRRNSLPRVHPKLPDYDALSARFEALKVPNRK